jgi:hypothetical protein
MLVLLIRRSWYDCLSNSGRDFCQVVRTDALKSLGFRCIEVPKLYFFLLFKQKIGFFSENLCFATRILNKAAV